MYKLSKFSYSYQKGGKQKIILLGEPITFKKNEVVAIVGPSGGGKSTLLKILKGIIPEYSSGEFQGEVTFKGKNLFGDNFQDNLKMILYMFQNPFSQLIYPRPEEEFLFSMENFNFSKQEMNIEKERFEKLFGLDKVWGKENSVLSSGECQRLVLASLLAINPEVLLLDEPTAFLDPQGRQEFYEFLEQIKKDRLIILVDHHIEEIKRLVTKTINVSIDGVITEMDSLEKKALLLFESIDFSKLGLPEKPALKLSLSNITFSHSNGPLLLDNVSAEFFGGEIIAIKGRNGVGKSTFFKIVSGVFPTKKGEVALSVGEEKITGRKTFYQVGFIFQNPETHFFFDTIKKELSHSFKYIKSSKLKTDLLERFFHDIDLLKSPYMLSEGEKRRLSILMTVFMDKALLLYDEPTFGQDQKSVEEISSLMKALKNLGIIQICISHDEDFIAKTCDRVFELHAGGLNEIS